MNHYRTSTGDRVSKPEIDRRVREAKALKIQQQLDEIGYNVCELAAIGCEMDESCNRLDCSHKESVDSCQKSGYSELAWDVNNIQILGRKCHARRDGLDLRFKK
jgi:hypothetical protein